MGNFTRDTFDKLKHFVGVRLQQGVPILDADWNEMEDIRKHELRTFLKWFVGNGVPKGNDGFHISPIAGGGAGTIVLTSNKGDIGFSSIVVNRDTSTAADALGFGPDNYSTSRTGSSPARLTGNAAGPFNPADGSTLVVSADGLDEEEVVFNQSDFSDISQATAAEVVDVINNAVQNFTASVGEGNDFIIKGGTGDVPGRCLVDGLDVIIEQDIKYTEQPLYENDTLRTEWDVYPLGPLSPPSSVERTDTVYLDVWEREVDAQEDNDLVNQAIGIETCVRMKREWVVRVAEGLEESSNLIDYLEENELLRSKHVYYPLASLNRVADAIEQENITDLRCTGLAILPGGITVEHGNVGIGTTTPENKLEVNGGSAKFVTSDGQHPLIVSRYHGTTSSQGIEEMRVGVSDTVTTFHYINDQHWNRLDFRMQNTDTDPGTGENENDNTVMSIKGDNDGGKVGIGTTEPMAKLDVNGDVKANNLTVMQYHTQQITTDAFGSSYTLNNLGQPQLKVSLRDAINAILSGALPGTPPQPLTSEVSNDLSYCALEDSNGNTWVFWYSNRAGNWDIWYNRRVNGQWEGDTQLTTDPGHDYNPYALEDGNGDIWVFWYSYREGNTDIWYNRCVNGTWEGETQLTTDPGYDYNPYALEDGNGYIWVFWYSYRAGSYDIWYNRWVDGTWEGDTPLTTHTGSDIYHFVLEDGNGYIWVFWASHRAGNYDIWYNRCVDGTWESETQLTTHTGHDYYPFVLEDGNGDIWVFWYSYREGNYDIWYNRCVNGTWEGEMQLTTDPANDYKPYALKDGNGDIWVFWHSNRAGNYDIWYNRCVNGQWAGDTPLTTHTANDYNPFVLEDQNGDIWVFWYSYRAGNYDVWYRSLITRL
ncbi:MAG: hypothetical protein GTO45_41035 [Candidatus Aminicenantes bacterium]|nr:hypothetical protein [Candidatus Aminicenantes bacterium]NIM84990.1 hypothetical protein [Candidatus Aminicenantes bacterium]NIN24504.1 hypothetical protein [Candidatus Aminicenantes bacterium]NIN48268.1 hypothetical protein [Candidatus Aminicenantes bacterium]NIN91171.1 hypothetical protein [Candidatus Aminicenantes bacterium]